MVIQRERRPRLEATRPVVTRLAWRHLDEVDRLAREQGVGRSAVVRQIVERHFEREAGQKAAT
jgi:hypothetical protein